MLNSVKLKTCVVLGRREASTVEAMRAALVDKLAGNLEPEFEVPPPPLPPAVIVEVEVEVEVDD